jgi:hypothetical protein
MRWFVAALLTAAALAAAAPARALAAAALLLAFLRAPMRTGRQGLAALAWRRWWGGVPGEGHGAVFDRF